MLQHAFDVWGALRVEIKTDVRNARSRAAIERIGGTCEGIFRQHMVVRDGRVRDTVYYSITDVDWRDPNHRAYKNAVSFGITPKPERVV
ncbi:MAG: GNAT family protein, partial [Gemmatimonadaceae bacterium]